MAGKIELMHGDCLELMQSLDDGSIDMILCDLPYGTTKNAWDTVIPFGPMWEQYKRIIRGNGAIVLFSAEPFTSALISSNYRMFRYDLIWAKPNPSDFLNANRKPMRTHENIAVFSKGQTIYNPQKTKGEPYRAKSGRTKSENWGEYDTSRHTANTTGERYPTTIIRENTRGDRKHPTEKPVKLLETLILTYTNGGVILDNCMGSGSTGVACVNTGRDFIGMELDDKYFAYAKERIENANAQIRMDFQR